MITYLRKSVAVLGGILSLVGGVWLAAQTKKPGGSSRETTESATREKILRYVRERFPISATAHVTVGPFRPSPYPDYYEATITVEDGKQKGSQKFFISKNGHYLIQGNIYTLGTDPKREVEREISTQNEPSTGPANAPVTIVEYADLQCPTCARMHEFLQKELLPKYGDKVRVIFKEFPLVNLHDWALTASVADQCAYQIAPSTFLAYRSMIFQRQGSINAANARDQLLAYGEQAGIDRLKLAGCLDSKASVPRVENDFREGQALGISSTPTFFINGKMVVGAPSAEEFYKAVDDALKGSG